MLLGGDLMSAGRRGLLLSGLFLGLAVWLCPGRPALAQPPGVRFQNDPGPGRHNIWKTQLTPEQIREALTKFGQDDGKNAWFEDMLKQAIRERNQNPTDEQVNDHVKRLMADKEFMDRVTDLAQKLKNQRPGNGNGQPPRLPQDDLNKIIQQRPQGAAGGDPFKVPDRPIAKANPDQLPPFHPNNPNFDRKRFPRIDPDNPPEFDKETKFPLDPETGLPVHPVTGKPIDPKNPPRFEDPVPPKGAKEGPRPGGEPPVPPKVGDPAPPKPPKFDPMTGRPLDDPQDDGKRRFDPDNPLGTPNDPPEKIAKTKAVEAATALWEKNVGPIDDSPAVKRAIIDLVSDTDAMDALTDGKGNNIFDFLKNESGDGDRFGDLFGKGGDSGWEWPKFDLPWSRGRNLDVDLGTSRPRSDYSPRTPRSSGSSSGGSGFNFGGVAVPWPVLLIILALIVAAILYWKRDMFFLPPKAVAFAGGPGEWPIDPRSINSREDVVKAFEFLSVLICGPGAKTWTHSTIAEELTALAATHGETAVKLARLYELARYAPLDEPLTRAELVEARRLVCDLAGIDEV
jgi:hypothetical protein